MGCLDLQNIWTSEHLNIRTSEHIRTYLCAPDTGCLDLQNIWASEHIRTSEHQNIWKSEQLNMRTLEHLNIRTHQNMPLWARYGMPRSSFLSLSGPGVKCSHRVATMMVGFIEGERRGGINSQNWIGIGTTFRMVNALTVASTMVRFIQRRGD